MKRKFLIVSPSYDDNVGGHVVLHKLCHMLNKRGVEAYLLPHVDIYLINSTDLLGCLYFMLKRHIKMSLTSYRVNPAFDTPVLASVPKDLHDPSWVVIYSEGVNGNPVDAKNVVRWFLHQPGFHTGDILYGEGELHVKYNSAIYDYHFPGCSLSSDTLKIIHYPTHLYNELDTSAERKGTAYCLRKGKDKELVHDTSDSILIDGKCHSEVAEIFKNVEIFISYDSLTAYSRFAALCGCTSVVIPDVGVTIDGWYPNERDRWGIAYGLSSEALTFARETCHLVGSRIAEEEIQCEEEITRFLENVNNHF